MPSTFYSLLRFARSAEAEATENFTTEALAACIRSDPKPMLRALQEAAVLEDVSEVGEVVAQTQVGRAGAGVIDLVLQLRKPGAILEVWVEVKVAAGESGRQIDNYRTSIAAQPAAYRPILVTLSRYPIRPDPYLLWVSWQRVRAHALTSTQPYWRDLARFLEEIHMADEFDAPVSAREAASMADALRLRGKVQRILWPFIQVARVTWPQVPFPTSDEALGKNIGVWYANRGRYVTVLGDDNRKGCWISMGVWHGDGEAMLGVVVHSDYRLTASRAALLAAADRGNLPPSWSRHMTDWEALVNRTRLVSMPDHDAARTWLRSRWEELEGAGILALMTLITVK